MYTYQVVQSRNIEIVSYYVLRDCKFLFHIPLYTLIYTYHFVRNLIYHPDIVLNESTGGVLSTNHK